LKKKVEGSSGPTGEPKEGGAKELGGTNAV